MNVFAQNWLFIPILMVVLGGTGTIIGPWIGSLIIYAHSLVRRQVLRGLASDHPGGHHHTGDAVPAVRHRGAWREGAPLGYRGLHRPALAVDRAGLLGGDWFLAAPEPPRHAETASAIGEPRHASV